VKQKLTLSVNSKLVNAAKTKRINLIAFVESELNKLLENGNNQCGWQESITNLLVNFRAESAAPSEGMGLRNNIRIPHNLVLEVKYLGKHSPPSNIYKGVIEPTFRTS